MKVLFVLTSHSALGDTNEKTGFWIEEFASPFYVLADAGVAITLATPNGGPAPIDPKSETAAAQTASTERYFKDKGLQDKVAHTMKLPFINHQDFDAVFYPGGHGPLWDLTKDQNSIELIEHFYNHQKPIAFVCHAPAALLRAKSINGEPLVYGKQITGFSNTEEEAMKLRSIVPLSVENELTKLGAKYSKGKDFASYVLQDGLLITGQNPASSAAVAKLLLEALIGKKKHVLAS